MAGDVSVSNLDFPGKMFSLFKSEASVTAERKTELHAWLLNVLGSPLVPAPHHYCTEAGAHLPHDRA